MSVTAAPLQLSAIKLSRIIELLNMVGLEVENNESFTDTILNPDSYNSERMIEFTLASVNMRFIIERSWATETVTGVFVYSLAEFTNGEKPFSKELIGGVNRGLSIIFAEEDWVEETADLPSVDVIHVDYGSQIAVIIREDGSQIGINLWELAGRTRRADNFSNWQYRDSGRI